MDLSYLYARRSVNLLSFRAEQYQFVANNMIPDIAVENYALPMSSGQLLGGENEFIAADILSITRAFQKQLHDLEQQVMMALAPNKSTGNSTITKNLPYLSNEISLAQIFTSLPQSNNIVCRQVLEQNLPTDERTFATLVESVLTPAEQNQLQSFNRPSKRREWLAGRIAAKEALRTLISNLTGAQISNADIEIDSLVSGKPYIANYMVWRLVLRDRLFLLRIKMANCCCCCRWRRNFFDWYRFRI